MSRALNACEGAVLLVDAAQGMEAQTIANLYLALEADLEIIPVLNKIDLPAARPDEIAREIAAIIGGEPDDVLRISAKTGEGVARSSTPSSTGCRRPKGDARRARPARSSSTRSTTPTAARSSTSGWSTVGSSPATGSGCSPPGSRARSTTSAVHAPEETPIDALGVGEVGVLSAAIKDVGQAKVGDTITLAGKRARDVAPLPGYREPLPMVFSRPLPRGLRRLLATCARRSTSCVSTTRRSRYEPETSAALGFGFRCGFLGLLHLEIVTERLDREFGIPLITTAPSVRYRVTLEQKIDPETGEPDRHRRRQPAGPARTEPDRAIEEPTVKAMILTPSSYVGAGHAAVRGPARDDAGDGLPHRGAGRAALPAAARGDHHRLLRPAEVDDPRVRVARLRGRGYAEGDLVRVDLLLNGEPVDAFSAIVHRDDAYAFGKSMTEKLRELIPRQMFDVPIQAAIGAKIIARETIKAKRKDVLAKCYGGDVSRKRKLLEKQKEGKKKMKNVGSVEVPQEAFVSALRTGGPRGD